MRLPLPLVVALLACLASPARATNVDYNDSARFLNDSGRLFRFDYANDFFVGTDIYYTQGLGATYFDPALKKAPLMPLLAGLPGAERSYGLGLRHTGYTPTSLAHDETLRGDRPFAAYFMLSHLLVSKDAARELTLTTRLDTGILGQGAGGKWIQNSLHRALRNLRPHGWDNQIRNDLVLDYAARLEKGLARWNWAALGVYGDATAGTLYDNAALGLSGELGQVDSARRKRLVAFGRVEERAVGYDATMQGGLLNRHSPYTLPDGQIMRTVARVDVGLSLDLGGWALEFTRTFLSREIRAGRSHQWAELSFLKRF